MEKNKEKKGRSVVNLFDIALILVALALGGLLYYANRQAGDPGQDVPTISTQKTTIRYIVEVTSLPDEIADQFKAGEPLIDLAKKYILGTVESIEKNPSRRLVTDYDQQAQVLVEEPGRTTMLLHVTAEAEVEELRITVDGGYNIRIGKGMEGKLSGGVFRGTVVAIERVDK